MNNPAALTSKRNAAAAHQQPNNAAAQVITAHGPVLQIDQKKVPVFHGEKDKVTMTVIAWCTRMEVMKISLL